MSEHLLAIAVGPVQDFINSARRTRDLWYGSELLSEISRTVAQAVESDGGNLIFPDISALKNKNQKIANVILSKLPDGISPSSVKDSAKIAAQKAWKGNAIAAKKFVDMRVSGLIESDIWSDQVDDVIEFYSAWKVLSSDNEYAETRIEVMRLLAGRKSCRDFVPAKGIQGRPKSSLDGARETIWNPSVLKFGILNEQLKFRLRLTDGEQLDAVGLTKRLGRGMKGYPSVSRIAVDPWLRGLAANPDVKGKFDDLKKECGKLKSNGRGVTDVGWGQFVSFPYEGTAVLRNRYKDLAKETGESMQTYNELDKIVKSLEDSCGIPEPYLAILMADGDQMGKVISSLTSADLHRKFSGKLAEFARKAQDIVENNNYGCLVYSGGDDVLAFVPVDTCLVCAQELHETFEEIMGKFPAELGKTPTLSVGIAVGHYLEPLEDLREYAHEAERDAKKPDRNGLAVHLHPRSGVPIKVRGRWCDEYCGNLRRWAKLHLAEQISDKAAYDLKKIAADYGGWLNPIAMKVAVMADIQRMLGRKRPSGTEAVPADVMAIIEKHLTASEKSGGRPEDVCKRYMVIIEESANEWLIARRIAKSMKQAQINGALETANMEGPAT